MYAALQYKTNDTVPVAVSVSPTAPLPVQSVPAAPADWVTGNVITTDTLAHEVIAAPGANRYIYVDSADFGNTSATTVIGSFNDTTTNGSNSSFIIPANSGNKIRFKIPLKVAANTHLTFTSSAGQSSIYCNVEAHIYGPPVPPPVPSGNFNYGLLLALNISG